jgi:hypothetical protein
MKPTLLEKIKWRINWIYTKYLMKKFEYLNQNCSKSGIDINSKRNPKLIISLTTFPPRYSFVHLTLESLLNQSLKPDKIILWLYDGEASDDILPEKILKLKSRGLEIRYVDENLKPYKKLIYSVRDFPEDIIITADDDTMYPSWWLEKMYEKHLEHKAENPKAILGYAQANMTKKSNYEFATYSKWEVETTINNNTFMIGVGGVFYPPKSLNKDLLNTELIRQLCPNNDDIWFKAMALLENRKMIRVLNNNYKFYQIEDSQEVSLYHINIDQSQNDIQLQDVFGYYNLFDKIT